MVAREAGQERRTGRAGLSTYAQWLRDLAADLHSGAVPMDDVSARVSAALEVPAPQGNPQQMREIAQDFYQSARALDESGEVLGKLRRDRLPEVWEGEDANAATGRMRVVERHVDSCRDVFNRVRGCLARLAGEISGAQVADRTAREYLGAALAAFRTAEDAQRAGAVQLLASGVDDLAAAHARFEEASGDAVGQLIAYTHAAETNSVLTGADLSPALGTERYGKSRQDLASLDPELVGYAFTYAERLGVPVELVIALLMQEQPGYANAPGPIRWAGGEVMRQFGEWGFGHGGDTSVGVAQMKPPTARRVLEDAGYGTFDDDYLRDRLTEDDEFAVALAVMHLKQDLDAGMTEKQAYLAYSIDEGTAARLMRPGDAIVSNSEDLSARSDRYDANMLAINEVGDLREFYGLTGS